MKARLFLLALLLALAFTGVAVSTTAHEVRSLHGQLETLRLQQDQALTRHSQLLLEIGAVASLSKVQRVAQRQLEMRFPERLEQIAP